MCLAKAVQYTKLASYRLNIFYNMRWKSHVSMIKSKSYETDRVLYEKLINK